MIQLCTCSALFVS